MRICDNPNSMRDTAVITCGSRSIRHSRSAQILRRVPQTNRDLASATFGTQYRPTEFLMRTLRRLLTLRVTSDSNAIRFGQYACYLAAPAVMGTSITAVARFSESPSEVLLGVLGGSSVALLLVILGMVMPLSLPGSDS